MQLLLYSFALSATTVIARPSAGQGNSLHWTPAGVEDLRGPCPMMNTLANHNYLPHDGRNITRDVTLRALAAALNFDASLATVMFDQALVANPDPNATYFSLDDLNRHNVLEHDASLSRSDAYFGNNHVFDASVFMETKKYWTDTVLTAAMLSNSKIARQLTSKAFNPTYKFASTIEQFSLGEVAAPIVAFGDMASGTVDRHLVEYFFENERLPIALGWKRKEQLVKLADVLGIMRSIENATSLLTTTLAVQARNIELREWHVGLNV